MAQGCQVHVCGFFFFQAEDGIRDLTVTGVQTCALPIWNRAIAVVGEPGNSLVAYVGAASGGIWKTEDGGVHWRAVFDSEPAQAIGALAIPPSAHNVVWAGTGETVFIRSMTALGNRADRS